MLAFLLAAIQGAKADINAAGTQLGPRLMRARRVARILLGELAMVFAVAPYGAYVATVYRSLPVLVPARSKVKPAPGTTPPPPATAKGVGPAPLDDPHQHHQRLLASSVDVPYQPRPMAPAPAAAAAAGAPQPPPRPPPSAAVHRGVLYGPAARNHLDVYAPQQRRQKGGLTQEPHVQAPPSLPVVFFLHGGIWASGEPWHYAPMAQRLAQEGCVVVVPTYTLYPEALADVMVSEVDQALTWAFDHVAAYGGDPARMTVAGHSAGGHLMAWALLRRAQRAFVAALPPQQRWLAPAPFGDQQHGPAAAAAAAAQLEGMGQSYKASGVRSGTESGGTAAAAAAGRIADEDLGSSRGDARDSAAYLQGAASSLSGAVHTVKAALAKTHVTQWPYTTGGAVCTADAGAAATAGDTRMPARFIGMSGVYDIGKHYLYEKSRGVHELSMMKRAMGGPSGFAAASPTVLLARAADAVAAGCDGSAPAHQSREPLLGEAIPLRMGLVPTPLGLGQHHPAAAATELAQPEEASPAARPMQLPASACDSGSRERPADGGSPSWQDPSSDGASGCGGGGDGDRRPGGTPQPPSPAVSLAAFYLEAARHLPPFYVMSSCGDHMVPLHEGGELCVQLHRCGVPHRHLIYNHVGHADFVTSWRKKVEGLRGLLPFAKDFVRLATDDSAGGLAPSAPLLAEALPCRAKL